MEGVEVAPSHVAIGAVIADRYRVLRLLGRGGMGEVFEAERDGKRYALKSFFRIEGGTDAPSERARFLREAAVTKNLSSDHIVHVHDHGFDPATGTPFIVMDLLSGEDLESTIGRVGPLDPRAAIPIVLQACRGLDAAHRGGIVHRDIKPANLFLNHAPGGDVIVKVCDFGIAKIHDGESLTATGSVLGSPLYMAPEQLVNAKVVDPRTDVWSLGMSLYHALAGVPAFNHVGTLAELVVAIARGAIPPLQDLAPWVPANLARVVHGTLLVQVASRCPSMQELSVALSAVAPKATKVTVEMLAPMPEATRAAVATRAEPPATWQAALPDAAALSETVMEEADPLVGSVLADRYKLVRVLGRGGMGAVYEATTEGGAGYALKVIRPDLGDTKGREAVKRFVREAKASQGIDSPYVARIVDAGADDAKGLPYITMELLHGRDLGRVIKDQGPIDPSAVLPVFVQACEGLAAAHARGIVHRDIKPANIFLHETKEGTVVAKLCDFGVAKQIAQADEGTELTRTGGILGSPMYMSPEQATNAKNVDHRSDLWSLGISLYEALTGQKAWEGTTMGELILAICTREVQPILELAPWLKPEIADIVKKALARKPDDRFASAEDFAASLRPFVTVKQVTPAAFKSASEERRKIAAAARSSSSVLSRSGASSTVEGHSASVHKTKGGKGVAIGAALAVLVAVGGGALLTRRAPAQQPASAAAVAPAPAVVVEATPKTVRAKLAIAPADATVRVNGAVVPVTAGEVTLEGLPGDDLAVVVESATGRAEAHVVLASDGKSVPPRVEVAAPAPSAKPGGSGAKPHAAPPAKPAGTTPAKPSSPSLKESW